MIAAHSPAGISARPTSGAAWRNLHRFLATFFDLDQGCFLISLADPSMLLVATAGGLPPLPRGLMRIYVKFNCL
jgi:hypothetical protein